MELKVCWLWNCAGSLTARCSLSQVSINICEKDVRYLNCSPADDGGEFGEIYDNYTGNGALGSVATLAAELSYGALYMW